MICDECGDGEDCHSCEECSLTLCAECKHYHICYLSSL